MNRRKFLALGAGVLVAAAVPAEMFAAQLNQVQFNGPGTFSGMSGDLVYNTTGRKLWVCVGNEWRRLATDVLEFPYGE